jgi:hypothetical protein
MPSTLPVNMQQVLQMGTHTEKLQHTIQTLPNVSSQQVNKERQQIDKLKYDRVQDITPSYFVDDTNRKTRVKKQVRNHKIKRLHDEFKSPEVPLAEDTYKGNINIFI